MKLNSLAILYAVGCQAPNPLWTPIDEIPYDLMWEDDRYWIPRMIRGERFRTRWIFDGDRMVDYNIEPDGTMADWSGRVT